MVTIPHGTRWHSHSPDERNNMTGFLFYIGMILVTWFILARLLYNTAFMEAMYDAPDDRGEKIFFTLFLSGASAIMWFITLPLALAYLGVRAVTRIYGTNATEFAEKWLDTDKK
jgi:Na+-translocating ferredoxin:NAD+ oxidoreductase RnfA subunit